MSTPKELISSFLNSLAHGSPEDDALALLDNCKSNPSFKDGCRHGILDKCEVTDTKGNVFRPLELAAHRGFAKVVCQLLQLGASTTLRSKMASGNTLLHITALHGDVLMMSMVIEAVKAASGSVDAVNVNGDTALMFSVHRVAQDNSSYEQVGHLLKAGASITVANHSGLNAAMVACTSSSDVLWKLLVRSCPEPALREAIKAKDVNGNTALHLASKAGCVEVCQSLVVFGSNMFERNSDHAIPIDVAMQAGNLDLVHFFHDAQTAATEKADKAASDLIATEEAHKVKAAAKGSKAAAKATIRRHSTVNHVQADAAAASAVVDVDSDVGSEIEDALGHLAAPSLLHEGHAAMLNDTLTTESGSGRSGFDSQGMLSGRGHGAEHRGSMVSSGSLMSGESRHSNERGCLSVDSRGGRDAGFTGDRYRMSEPCLPYYGTNYHRPWASSEIAPPPTPASGALSDGDTLGQLPEGLPAAASRMGKTGEGTSIAMRLASRRTGGHELASADKLGRLNMRVSAGDVLPLFYAQAHVPDRSTPSMVRDGQRPKTVTPLKAAQEARCTAASDSPGTASAPTWQQALLPMQPPKPTSRMSSGPTSLQVADALQARARSAAVPRGSKADEEAHNAAGARARSPQVKGADRRAHKPHAPEAARDARDASWGKCEAKMNAAAGLGLQPQQAFGVQLEELSISQLDALEEFHYQQLEVLSNAKLQKHRELRSIKLAEGIQLANDLRDVAAQL